MCSTHGIYNKAGHPVIPQQVWFTEVGSPPSELGQESSDSKPEKGVLGPTFGCSLGFRALRVANLIIG